MTNNIDVLIYGEVERGKLSQITMELLGIGNYVLCTVVFIVFSLLFPDKQKTETKETL